MKTFFTYFFASICIFLAPIQGLLIAVGCAIVLDTFFGIYRSVKVRGWQFITSRRLSEIISKMLLYQLCIICIYAIDFHLLSEISNHFLSVKLMGTKITAMLLIFIETVSIKENFEKATGLDVWQLLKKALGRAKEVKDSINDVVK
jgi:hypothetical protein